MQFVELFSILRWLFWGKELNFSLQQHFVQLQVVIVNLRFLFCEMMSGFVLFCAFFCNVVCHLPVHI